MSLRAFLSLVVLVAACGGPQAAREDDLTAEQHEDEAIREEGDADSSEDLEHAEAHRRRAEELRAFEAVECAQLSADQRASCPLLLHLQAVVDIEGGSRLTFADDQNIGPVLEMLRCHIAFAAAQGREGIDECALYVPGATLRSEENVVLLTTDQVEHVDELRRRVAVQAP